MKIDHVSIAWSDLTFLQEAFESVGLKTDYGGVHSSGATHMSLLAFKDGSYIELISVVKPGTPSPSWGRQISGNGGPCAWAVQADDPASEVRRIKSLGVSTIGPDDYYRERPDGVLVEWQLAFIGDGEPGATLPFLIKDKTPREYRVKPSSSVATSELSGVMKVILGVRDLEREVKLFQKVYGWNEPIRNNDLAGEFRGLVLADFEDAPVVIASPMKGDTWLSKRLGQFGDSPCAFLIGTSSVSRTRERYDLKEEHPWIQGSAAWIPSSKLGGIRLGFKDA
jgi:hypothetical protein